MAAMLHPVDENVWTAHLPDFRFWGLRLGTRMTIVRLPSGRLWVHSPIAPDDALRRAINALGEVAHVVCPNLYHHVFAGPFAEAYPDAALYGPRKLGDKRSDLTFHSPLESLEDGAFEGELVPIGVDGCILGETVFVHRPTRTIVSADLIENFDTSAHWPTRAYLKASGIHGRAGLSWTFRPFFRDKPAARASIDRLLSHDPTRIIISHGDRIVEEDARATLEATYRFLG